MRLQVKPIYGWGWRSSKENNAVDVPQPFEFDARIIKPGEPFDIAVGLFQDSKHPLGGHWIVLQQRHNPSDGACNLLVYVEDPSDENKKGQKTVITGFADVVTKGL